MLRLARTSRLLAAAFAAVLFGTSQAALACGESGAYGYAGLIGSEVARGVRADLSAHSIRVDGGHVAAWVGVGGPGAGAMGQDEWIQVGLVAYQGSSVRLYFEVMRGTSRQYVELDSDVALLEEHRVAVREIRGAPGWWRGWADRRPVTEPIYLRGSLRRWQPVATAESWSACAVNEFHFRFRRTEVTPGRAWRRMRDPFVLAGPAFRVLRWGRGFDALS